MRKMILSLLCISIMSVYFSGCSIGSSITDENLKNSLNSLKVNMSVLSPDSILPDADSLNALKATTMAINNALHGVFANKNSFTITSDDIIQGIQNFNVKITSKNLQNNCNLRLIEFYYNYNSTFPIVIYYVQQLDNASNYTYQNLLYTCQKNDFIIDRLDYFDLNTVDPNNYIQIAFKSHGSQSSSENFKILSQNNTTWNAYDSAGITFSNNNAQTINNGDWIITKDAIDDTTKAYISATNKLTTPNADKSQYPANFSPNYGFNVDGKNISINLIDDNATDANNKVVSFFNVMIGAGHMF